MHEQAMAWLAGGARMTRDMLAAGGLALRVCELGSRDVNGSPRVLFLDAESYVGVDLLSGKGVDVTADAATWTPLDGRLFTVVLCCEVLEHARGAAAVVRHTIDLLVPGGVLLVTCAGPARAPHGVDGGPLRAGEWYRGIAESDLVRWIGPECLLGTWCRDGVDVYAMAIRRGRVQAPSEG